MVNNNKKTIVKYNNFILDIKDLKIEENFEIIFKG